MKQLPTCLKDTANFLEEILDIRIHRNTRLITVNVKSLYTDILNEEVFKPAMRPGADKNSLIINIHGQNQMWISARPQLVKYNPAKRYRLLPLLYCEKFLV